MMFAQPSSHRRLFYTIVLLALVALAIWLPRAFALDRFTATDEVVWIWRSANFYYSLGQRDFGVTYITKHPGVVNMWVETVAFLLEFPEYRGFGQGWLDKYALFEVFAHSQGVDPHDILVTSRKLTVLLNTALLAFGFLYARNLFGVLPSLVGFLFIAFDPFHSGITRMAHLDGTMGSFAILSLLAFLSYLHAGRRASDLLISAVAAGLSILAKISGFLVIPTIGLIALWDFWERRSEIVAPGGSTSRAWTSALIKPIAIWGLVLLVTIFVFFPAMWVNPLETLKSLALSPFDVAENAIVDMPISTDNEQVEEQYEITDRISGKPLTYLVRYLYRYLWRITPVILAGLFLALTAWLAKTGGLADGRARQAVRGLLLFVITYTIFLTIPAKSSEKYYLPVYAVLDLIAGIGWYSAVDWARKFAPPRLRVAFPVISLAGVVLLQAVLALRTFPYYLTYFNPLLGGNPRANEMLNLGSGEGLDLAADYLNQKPNAELLKVMSWYGIGPFSYYFVGDVTPLYGSKAWSARDIAQLQQMDYLVIYVNQWKRQLPGGLFPWLEGLETEHCLWYDGIELVRIYNVKSIPLEKFSSLP